MKDKRGIFFSTDAIIALSIILMVIISAYPIYKTLKIETKVHYDIIETLSNLKTGEIDSPYVQSLISSGAITDKNKTLLEQIAEFSITNELTAKSLASSVLGDLKTKENIGLWFGNQLIYSNNKTPYDSSKDIEVTRQIITGISGIPGTNSTTGFSAKAYLTKTLQNKYFYFGGYVGDGNISQTIEYNGNISALEMELAINNNFTLYVNGINQGIFSSSENDKIPISYNLSTSNLHSGTNLLELKGTNLHISGGFVKIEYSPETSYAEETKHYIPGVNGLINIYDGLYIPGNISSMHLSITFNSSRKLFVTMGNKTLLSQTTSGLQTITKTNSDILNILGNYNEYNGKTIPLRIGLENISYIPGKNNYIISVVDLSGGASSAKSGGEQGVAAIKTANRLLVNNLLSYNNTQVGLIGLHQGDINPLYSHPLTSNRTALNNTINVWTNNGNLDLCYGIQNATNTLSSIGSSEDFKSIVLLGTKYPTSCLGSSGNIWNNTYNLACSSWTQHKIKINTIGIIGNSQSDANLNNLLYNISVCTNGTYHDASSTNNDIVQLYNQTFNDIVNIFYYLQTVQSSDNLNSYLSPNSYIEYTYTSPLNPIGIIITTEKQFDNSLSGTFSLPENSSIIKAEATPYSGSLWTNELKINSQSTYKLTEYGNDYIKLGDPFVINIPNDKILSNNNVSITTALSPANSSPGSIYNKIVYTIMKNASSFSKITSKSEGCSWNLTFYDNTNSVIDIPSDYQGTSQCSFSQTTVCNDLNDATSIATCNLLKILDFDSDGKIETRIKENYLQISSAQVTGIPYTYSMEVQARVWR